ALAISTDGLLVAHAGIDSQIRVLDIPSRTLRCSFHGHSGDVNCLSFSPDGSRLVSCGADGTVRIWDIPSQSSVGLWPDPNGRPAVSVTFAPDGNSIFSANSDEIRVWSSEPESQIETHQQWGDMQISPNGKWLVTSDSRYSDGSAALPAAKVWDIASRQQR